MLGLIIALALIIALILLLNTSITAVFKVSLKEKEFATQLEITYLFIRKNLLVDKEKKTSKKESASKKESSYINLYKLIKDDVFKILRYLLKNGAVFEQIQLKTEFGFSDVSQTGIMTGTLNALFYNVMAYFHNNFKVKDWNIEVNPDFENEKFNAFFDCIVKLKIVHIIFIGFYGLKILNKIKKMKGRKNNGTSD